MNHRFIPMLSLAHSYQEAGAVRYLTPGTPLMPTTTTVEEYAELPITEDGTIKWLKIHIPENSYNGSAKVTVRLNRADTILSQIIEAGGVGPSANLQEIPVVAGDRIVIKVDGSGASMGRIAYSLIGIWYGAKDKLVNRLAVGGSSHTQGTTKKNAFNLCGALTFSWHDATSARFRVRTPFTASDIYGYVSKNTRTSDTILSVSRRFSNATCRVIIPAGRVGPFFNSTQKDDFIIGDDAYISFETTEGEGSITIETVALTISSKTNKIPLIAGSETLVGGEIQDGEMCYRPLCGGLPGNMGVVGRLSSREVEVTHPSTFTLSDMSIAVDYNGMKDDFYITTMKNGADTNLRVKVGASRHMPEGHTDPSYIDKFFSNMTDRVRVEANKDVIAVKTNTPNRIGSHSATFFWFGFVAEFEDVGAEDVTSPSISITTPSAGSTVSGTISLSATVTDNVEVRSVHFLLDGQTIRTFSTSADNVYSSSLGTAGLSNGLHEFKVYAWDTSNNFSQKAITFTTDNVDAIAPVVAFNQPLNGASVSGMYDVIIRSSDANGIKRIEFYVDNVFHSATDNPPPEPSGTVVWHYHRTSWNTASVPNGSHTLLAKAYDLYNNVAQRSISVTVANGMEDTTPPTVTINIPTSGGQAKYEPYTFDLEGTATDNFRVDKVELLVDGVVVGQAPETTNWLFFVKVSGLGQHTIEVRATDSSENIGSDSIILDLVDLKIARPEFSR